MTDGPIAGYSVAETGAYVLEAFKKPQEWIGKDLRIASDIFTPRQFVKAVMEITGNPIQLHETDRARFKTSKEIIEELWANMEWFYKHNGNTNRDLDITQRVNPGRKCYREFIEANKEEFIAFFDS